MPSSFSHYIILTFFFPFYFSICFFKAPRYQNFQLKCTLVMLALGGTRMKRSNHNFMKSGYDFISRWQKNANKMVHFWKQCCVSVDIVLNSVFKCICMSVDMALVCLFNQRLCHIVLQGSPLLTSS